MATVGKIGGMRVVIYSQDHRPSHVHVIGAGSEYLFHLRCPNGPPELREVRAGNAREAARLMAEVAVNLADYCRRWGEIHGAF